MTTVIDFEAERAHRIGIWKRWSDEQPPEDVLVRTRHPYDVSANPTKGYRHGDKLFLIREDGTAEPLFGPYDIIEWMPG